MLRLKELRTKNGWSMKQTAAKLGLAYTTYISYEKGEREPNSEMLIKLSDFFGVTIDYLIGKTDSPEAIRERVTESELKFALFGHEDISEDMFDEVKRYAAYLAKRKE